MTSIDTITEVCYNVCVEGVRFFYSPTKARSLAKNCDSLDKNHGEARDRAFVLGEE